MSDDGELATRRLRLKLALEDLREMKGFGTPSFLEDLQAQA